MFGLIVTGLRLVSVYGFYNLGSDFAGLFYFVCGVLMVLDCGDFCLRALA